MLEAEPLTLTPIGVVKSPFRERVDAPRQPRIVQETRGSIQLFAGHNFEHALEGLTSFKHIWVLFWFHLNHAWRPKVTPPRSSTKVGVFASRSPYRPNPIGLSVLELDGIEGLTLHVKNLDLLDQTPVLDIKPYLAYADAILDTPDGWVAEQTSPPDPGRSYTVVATAQCQAQLQFLQHNYGILLWPRLEQVLKLGPEPHAYRRIKRTPTGYVLAIKDWRIHFQVEAYQILATAIESGYRPRQLAEDLNPALDVHRAFVAQFSV